MSTMSVSPPLAARRQRTRNAQAQADLRVRRKNYIKTLEETVSRLEGCVRQLRAQQDIDPRSTGSNSDGGCHQCQELRLENARLRQMVREAGLPVEQQGAPSTLTGIKAKTRQSKVDEDEDNWSKTSSITTKKRKLSKMHAFALQVDSQLGGVHSTCAQQQQANLNNGNVLGLQELGLGAASCSTTPSTSSRDSVVSHRSPQTPRLDCSPAASARAGLASDDQRTVKREVLVPMHIEPAPVSQWPTYAEPVVLAPVSLATMMPASFAESHPTLPQASSQFHAQQAADLTTWLAHQQLQASTAPPPSTLWLSSDYATSSASIRDFHRSHSFPRSRRRRRLLLPQPCREF